MRSKRQTRPVRVPPVAVKKQDFLGEEHGSWRLLERVESLPNRFVFRSWNDDSRRWGTLECVFPQHLDEVERERFNRRREILRELNHPCILPMLDCGNEPFPFIVEEFSALGTVYDNFDLLSNDLWRALRMARDVAVGLKVVHESEVVHRNVEPRTIVMMSLDHSALGGFEGVHSPGLSPLTSTGERVGVRAFAPPESYDRSPSPAFDVFCLGATLHAVLLGVRTPSPLYSMRTSYNPVSLALASHVVEKVNLALEKMLAFDPSARPQSMDQILEQFDEILWMGRLSG